LAREPSERGRRPTIGRHRERDPCGSHDHPGDHRLAHRHARAPADELTNLSGFDWNGADTPPALHGVYDEQPLAVDLRWAHSPGAADALVLTNPDFREAVTSIAAGVLGIPRSEFDAVVRSMKRRAMLLFGTILAALLILSLTIVTNIQLRRDAENQRDAARAEQALAVAATELARAELDGVTADLAAKQSELDDATANLAAAQSDLDDATADLAAATADLAEATGDLETARAARAVAEAERAAALDAVAAAQSEVDRLGSELATLEDAVDAAARDLAFARAEADRQLAIADARRLSGLALASLPTDLAKASLLAVEAAGRTGLPGPTGFAALGPTAGLPRLITDNTTATYEARDALVRTLQENPQLAAELPTGGVAVSTVAINARRTIIAGPADGFVHLWDARTLQPIRRLTADVIASSPIAISPDGGTLAVGTGRDAVISFIDTASGAVTASLPLANEFVVPRALTFTPDGRYFIAGATDVIGLGDRAPARVWDRSTLTPFDLSGTSNVSGIAVRDDSQLLATLDDESGGAMVWGLDATGWQLQTIVPEPGGAWYRSLTFEPTQGRLVLGADDGGIVSVDTTTLETAVISDPVDDGSGDGNERVRFVLVSRDGRHVYSSIGGRVLRLAQGAGGPAEPELSWTVSDNEVGALLLDAVGRPVTAGFDEPPRVWNPERDQQIGRRSDRILLGVQPSGDLMALGADLNANGFGAVDVVDVASLARRRTLRPPESTSTVSALTISASGTVAVGIVTGPDDFSGRLTAWDLRTGAVTVDVPLPSSPQSLVLSPDGALVAGVPTGGGNVPVRSTSTGALVGAIPTGGTGVAAVDFGADGIVVTATSTEVATWRLGPTTKLTGAARTGVRALAVDRSSDTVLVTDTSRLTRLDMSTLEPLGDFIAPPDYMLTAVAVAADGATVVAAADRPTSVTSGAIVVWDGADRQMIGAPLVGHEGQFGEGPSEITFAASNRLVSSGSRPSTRVWDLDVASWIDLACRRANRNLTQDEWINARSLVPYRSTCPQFAPG